MKKSDSKVYEEQKKLVLARFKTLNQESKLLLGSEEEFSVKELMDHIEKGDEFGKRIVKVQINLLRFLASAGE